MVHVCEDAKFFRGIPIDTIQRFDQRNHRFDDTGDWMEFEAVSSVGITVYGQVNRMVNRKPTRFYQRMYSAQILVEQTHVQSG